MFLIVGLLADDLSEIGSRKRSFSLGVVKDGERRRVRLNSRCHYVSEVSCKPEIGSQQLVHEALICVDVFGRDLQYIVKSAAQCQAS